MNCPQLKLENQLCFPLYAASKEITRRYAPYLPLLKKLEAKGYIQRTREQTDERCLSVSLTDQGESLKRKAAGVPKAMASCVNLSDTEAKTLYKLLYKVLEGFEVG